MSFFEPLPPPPPPAARRWAPPAWDRPSEGTLPAFLPIGELLHRDDAVAVTLEHLRVYPNGFTINLAILTNPHRDERGASVMMVGAARLGGGHPLEHLPRIGVRFSDGRTAGRGGPFHGPFQLEKDERGFPTEPYVSMAGGGGGSHGWHFGVWVYPLPPDGPLEIFVALPAAGVDEAKVTVDGSAVRAAASGARVLWS